MHTHLLFDLLAWTLGIVAGWSAHKFRRRAAAPFSDKKFPVFYYTLAAVGAVWGAYFFGTLNIYLSGETAMLGRSIVGAIVGGIIGVEFYKLLNGISGSTGGGFVAALGVGITIGRFGCYFSGVEDFTYGTETLLPWGVDFGDGVRRHPVQLYEAALIGAFTLAFFVGLARQKQWAVNGGFYWFVMIYSGQRFLWEFLKPYQTLLGPFNLFHLVTAALMVYSIYMLYRLRKPHGHD